MKYDKSDINAVSLITKILGIPITSNEYDYLYKNYYGFVKEPIAYSNLREIIIDALNNRK